MNDSNVNKFAIIAIAGTACICLIVLVVHWFGLVNTFGMLVATGAGVLAYVYRGQVLYFLGRASEAWARRRQRRNERREVRRQRRNEMREVRRIEKQNASAKLDIQHFHTKVVGVTHENDDGSDRQRFIKRCRAGEELLLEHDEHNDYDPNAISVCRQNGKQIGFLNSDLAEEVIENSAEGRRYAAFVSNLTGGTRAKPTRGVNLLIVNVGPGIRPRHIRKYLDSISWD